MRPPLNPKEKPNPDLSGIKKVILIRLRRIGDIVMTTPAITALRKGLPSAHISYVVEMPYRELIEGNPHLDKAIVLPRPLGTKNFWNTVRKIRKERFDAAIDFHGGPTASLLTLFCGAGNEFREWGISNWIKLVSILLKKQTVKIVMIGASEDAEIAGQILGRHSSSVFSLVGKLNLRELKELISRASLYVGPDSGPMHIAASTSTPIVAYFGPNLSAYNAPWQAKAVIIEKDMNCRPCDQRHCNTGDFRCMRTITPEEVYAACTPFL